LNKIPVSKLQVKGGFIAKETINNTTCALCRPD